MKIVRSTSAALALFALAACGEVTPTVPAEPEMTETRFLELRESAMRIAERVQETGTLTAVDRAALDALERELVACVGGEAGDGTLHATPGATSSGPAGISVGIWPGGDCQPCPLIISRGSCIGVLRSEGPCRAGAGLERCFYNWYCYGTTAA
jgi:hypothetical protein